MKSHQPVCVTFAGVVGCGKTPVAYYLSQQLGWPILNNDTLRTETVENTLNPRFDTEAYEHLKQQRQHSLMSTQKDFIYDASVDRKWSQEHKQELEDYGYGWFIVSFNLSYQKLKQFMELKNYQESLARLDTLYQEHEVFLRRWSEDVSCIIDDVSFLDRMHIILQAVRGHIDGVH